MTEPSPSMKGTLRDAVLDDCIEASKLLVRLGLTMPEDDDAVRAYFENLWVTNPAIQAAKTKPALGWVLEDAGEMVGFFGNVPLLYEFGGKPVIVSVASLWGVDENYRSETPRLADAYFSQTDADVLLVTTAIKPTRRIFERHGGLAVPQPDLDQVLYWVIDGPGFARAGLRKKGVGGISAFLGGTLAGIGLNARLRLGGRRPFAALDGISIIRPDAIGEIGDGFEDLWRKKTKEYPGRLLASRTASALTWHFGVGRFSDYTRMICLSEKNGGLKGYAAVVREDAPAIGLKRLRVADLFVADDDPAAVNALLTAAFEYGLSKRCHVLEVIGLTQTLRALVQAHKPLERRKPSFPFFYKAVTADLSVHLETADGWYVTPYDGDQTLL